MAIDWGAALEPAAPAPDHIAGIPVAELLPADEATTMPASALDPYDLEPVRAKLAPYEAELARMQAEAESMKVSDSATAEQATALGVRCRKIEKAVEDARTFFKRPALEFGKSIDALAKLYTTKAQAAAGTLSRKVASYQAKVRAEEMERLRKEQEAARALQVKAEAEAKAAGTDAPAVIIPKAVPATPTIRTEGGKAVMATRWVCTVTDAALVPREYCEPVQRLLNEAVKAGIREIPGCVIEQKTETRFGA